MSVSFKYFLLLLIIHSFVIIVVDTIEPKKNICNTVGFSGPGCQYLDCGLNGRLNSNLNYCICDEGFTGLRCNECIKYPNQNREYICCPLNNAYFADIVSKNNNNNNKNNLVVAASSTEINFLMQWSLLAPKTKDSFRFLSGFYSTENCIYPGNDYQYNETLTFTLGCNCKLIAKLDSSAKKRTVLEDKQTEEEQQQQNIAAKISIFSSENQKRIPTATSELEFFLQQEISKRDAKIVSNYFTPAYIADLLTGESGISQLRATPAAAAILNNNNNSNSNSCVPTIFSSAESLLVFVILTVFVLIIFNIVIGIFVYGYYNKEIKNASKLVNALKTTENIQYFIENRKSIKQQIKNSKYNNNHVNSTNISSKKKNNNNNENDLF